MCHFLKYRSSRFEVYKQKTENAGYNLFLFFFAMLKCCAYEYYIPECIENKAV